MKLPHIPGFKYAPRVHTQGYNGTTVYAVRQMGFWMDPSVIGPTKPTEQEAIAAWKRLVRKTRQTRHGGLKQNDEDLKAERRIRELIVAAHTLTLIDHANTYPPVTVRVEDLQALLRLLDRARLNTKERKL